MKGRGFWFNPETGEFKEVTHSTHLRAVMAEPETFGVTAGFIAQRFERTGERVGLEGEARRLILLAVLENSPWVRWRETNYSSCRWSVEAWTREKWNPSDGDLVRIVRAYSGHEGQGWDRFELKYLFPAKA